MLVCKNVRFVLQELTLISCIKRINEAGEINDFLSETMLMLVALNKYRNLKFYRVAKKCISIKGQ